MTVTKFGYHKIAYITQVTKWARSLGAEEVTIHYDGSVTATCKDGGICSNYKPAPSELAKVYQQPLTVQDEDTLLYHRA